MTILRPITNKSPSSISTIDSTNLPFGFTLQPYGHCRDISHGDDDAFFHHQTKPPPPQPPHQRQTSPHRTVDWNYSSESKLPIRANLIAKCTHCGSPLNPTSPFVSTWTVVCNFCAQTYRVDYETQRRFHESIYAHTNTSKNTNTNRRRRNGYFENGGDYDNDGDGYGYGHVMDEHEERREVHYKRRYDGRDSNNLKECRLSHVEYSLPLFGMTTNVGSRNRNRNRNRKKQHLNEIYSIPASMCPPLLTIIIDGTSKDPTYYRTICSSLNRLLKFNSTSNSNDNSDNKSNSTHANFKGCKIGIFIMTKGGGLSVFDLKSPGGHVKHLWVHPSPLQRNTQFVDNDNNTANGNANVNAFDDDDLAILQGRNHIIPLSDVLDVEDIYVPLDNDYNRSCVESALRALADSTIFNQACQRNNDDLYGVSGIRGGGNTAYGIGGAYFGSTIQYILEFLEEVAYHPGMYQAPREFISDNNENGNGSSSANGLSDDVESCVIDKFLYAGGKLMCFLAGPPNEIGTVQQSPLFGRIGTGGFGGSCAEMGRRFSVNKNNIGDDSKNKHTTSRSTMIPNPEEFHNDIEEGSVSHKKSDGGGKNNKRKPDDNDKKRNDAEILQTAFLNVDAYYQSLGIQCAHQALSVEVFGLVHEDEGIYLGFPYLKLLSERSGGSGPLLISLSKNEQGYNESNNGNDIEDTILVKEVIARSTLTRQTSFGALLRIRLSPSLKINDNGIEENDIYNGANKGKASNRLFDYYSNNGIYGSFSPSSSDPELFFTGACDVANTLAFQVEISSKSQSIDDYAYVEGASMSDVQLIPAVQICFAYTGVVMNNGNWTTVRRIRVSTHKLSITNDVEAVTTSLNAEALAVILFHRFYALSLISDINLINSFARNWLLNTLVECYRSAEKQKETEDKYGSDGFGDSISFYPADRLLNVRGGHFGEKEILLAQGHEKLQVVPLLIYSLIQCDALRPVQGTFRPSIDARAAAAANMSNMSPSVLSRCIAPRLELWMSDKIAKEPIHSSMGMSFDDIKFTVIDLSGLQEEDKREESSTKESMLLFGESPTESLPQPLLLLDSPREIAIYDCNAFTGREKRLKWKNIPTALRKLVQEAAESYRVEPTFDESTNGTDLIASLGEGHHLRDALVEDSCIANQTYTQWLNLIAEMLHREVTV